MADRLTLSWRCVAKGLSGILVPVFAVLVLGPLSRNSLAEPYPDLLGASLQPHRIYRNYAGDFVMRFPNYDFVLFSPTRSSPALPGELQPGLIPHGPIVFRNNAGMKWDGSRLFLHPAYPHRMIERYRFSLNMISEPLGTKWPELEPDIVSTPPLRDPKLFEPPIGYRPLPPEVSAWVRPPEGLPKYSPSGTALKPTDLMPQYRHPVPSGSIPTQPVSTVLVRPWPSATVDPPRHDSLGTVAPFSSVIQR